MYMGPEPLDFDDAEAYCSSQGRHLVSIHSETEQHQAEALCGTVEHSQPTSYGCWIGLSDFFGTLKWNDDTETDYGFDDTSGEPTNGVFPWITGQPSSDNEGCINLWSSSFQWNDLHCSGKPNYPLCAGDGTGDVLFSRVEQPLTVEADQLVTYVDITDEMHFEMDIMVNQFPNSWFVYIYWHSGTVL